MPDVPAHIAPTPVLVVTFTEREITAVRHTVSRYAARAGLHGDRLDDFVLAVNEIVTDTAVCGAGHGELRLWVKERTVGCEVLGTHPGEATAGKAGPADPGRRDGGRLPGTHGRGLQLARILVDSLDVLGSPVGTAIRLVTALPATG